MSKSVLETLEAARKLITPEEAWLTGGRTTRTAGGEFCTFSYPGAASFCAMMAINRVSPEDREHKKAVFGLMDKVCGMPFDTYNDTHTHKQVLAAFDAAIEKANQDRSDV